MKFISAIAACLCCFSSIAQNVGVGTSTPAYTLDVNGRARFRHNSFSSGFWLNKSDNTEGAFIGMVNDSTAGFWGNATAGSYKVGIDVKNGLMGIGTTDPTAPLSFANTIGNKVSLFGDAGTGHYGMGIQSGLFQIYSNSTVADIALGYGSSSSFTEVMRVKGNGTVGVGTTTPFSKFTVTKSGIGVTQESDDQTTRIGFYTATGSAFVQTHSNHDLNFTTNNGSSQMVLKTNGNVGIGLTSPANKLEVNGTSKINGALLVGNPTIPGNMLNGVKKTLFQWVGTTAHSVGIPDPDAFPNPAFISSDEWTSDGCTVPSGSLDFMTSKINGNPAFHADFPPSGSTSQRRNLYTPWISIPGSMSTIYAFFDFSLLINQPGNNAGMFLSYTTDGVNYTQVTSYAAGGYNGTGNFYNPCSGIVIATPVPCWTYGWASNPGYIYGTSVTSPLPISGKQVKFRFTVFRNANQLIGAAMFDLFNFTVSGIIDNIGGSFASGSVYAENNVYAGMNVQLGDVAEYFDIHHDASLEAGDLVAIDNNSNNNYRKSSQPYDLNLFGVISSAPTVTLNSPTAGSPVALAGRVKVKVSNINGAIKPGDYLTSSSIPGVAMKATRQGQCIGRALEFFDQPNGTILCLIQTGLGGLEK